MNVLKEMPVILRLGELNLACTTIRDDHGHTSFIIHTAAAASSQQMVRIYQKIRKLYGAFVSAAVDVPEGPLILTDAAHNELHLQGCGCGNHPGSEATFIILNSIGLPASRSLIYNAQCFYLEQPGLKRQCN